MSPGQRSGGQPWPDDVVTIPQAAQTATRGPGAVPPKAKREARELPVA